MTTQQELPISHRIPSRLGKRPIQLSSLRPGDWLEAESMQRGWPRFRFLVLQNSAALGRIEIRYTTGNTGVFSYRVFTGDVYLGQGRKRSWWPLLPKWAKKWVAPYSGPEGGK